MEGCSGENSKKVIDASNDNEFNRKIYNQSQFLSRTIYKTMFELIIELKTIS